MLCSCRSVVLELRWVEQIVDACPDFRQISKTHTYVVVRGAAVRLPNSFFTYSCAGCGHQALSIQIKPCKSAANWEWNPVMESIGQP